MNASFPNRSAKKRVRKSFWGGLARNLQRITKMPNLSKCRRMSYEPIFLQIGP